MGNVKKMACVHSENPEWFLPGEIYDSEKRGPDTCICGDNGVVHPWVYGSAEACPSEGDIFNIEVMPLYTAPPAPVVPYQHHSVIAEQLDHVLSSMDATDHQRAVINCAVNRLNKVAEILQRPPSALSVPEALDYQNAKELFNYLMTEEETNATVNGWNACRAAMFQGAEPVTTAYKLPKGLVAVPVEPTVAMRKAFHKANDECEQYVSPDHQWAAMLAAAPQQEVK